MREESGGGAGPRNRGPAPPPPAPAGGTPPAGARPATSRILPPSIAFAMRAAGGRVPFARFMELALTDPQAGYYTRGEGQLGRGGDFVTIPGRVPLFNRAMARLLADLVDALRAVDGSGSPVSIWEIGGGRGDMVAGILSAWDSTRPDLRSCVRWRLQDVSPWLAAAQQERLAAAQATGWTIEWGPVRDTRACEPRVVVTNELIDALPVHILDTSRDRVRESWVEVHALEDVAAEVWHEPCSEALSELTLLFGTAEPADIRPFAEDGVVEVRPAVSKFFTSVTEGMGPGGVVTVDYGGRPARPLSVQDEGAADCRYRRTVRAYLRHERRDDLYSYVGRQDLTADVDFGALDAHGRCSGFDCLLYTTIANLAAAAGGHAEVEALKAKRSGVSGGERAPHDKLDLDRTVFYAERLLNPDDVGGLFRVMVQVRE